MDERLNIEALLKAREKVGGKILLTVTVRTREHVLFNGQAKAVTSFNQKGVFDILPLHANFITLIQKMLIIYGLGGNKVELMIGSGVLKVTKDQVSVYLGVVGQVGATPPPAQEVV